MGIGAVNGTCHATGSNVTSDTGQQWSAGLSCKLVAARPVVRGRRPAQVAVITLTGGLAAVAVRGLAPALTEVALSAFAAPPWNETPSHARQLAARMLADASHPGFALALAFTGGGTCLTGFGYGLPPLPGAGERRRLPPLRRAGAVRVLRACRQARRARYRGRTGAARRHPCRLRAAAAVAGHPSSRPPGSPSLSDERLADQPGIPERC